LNKAQIMIPSTFAYYEVLD